MKNLTLYVFYLSLLFLAELLYLRLARSFNIQAIPNERSAHSQNTLVGGGIIVPLACILYFCTSNFQYPFFIIGILLVSFVSLIDDVREVSIKVRLLSQIIAISLIFFQFNLYTSSTLLVMIVVACIMTISLNAYNFLDGINGMTSAYSLIQLACLYYINQFKVHFIDGHLLIIIALAVIVFTYFNFRVKAICFAGDVGSISIALIVCGCIFKLIMLTHNFIFINLLLVYYLDAVSTFIFRWLQGQDVFKAHKKHFYLFLVNDLKWPHLTVASLYATVQLVINLIVINAFDIKGSSSNYYHLQYAGLFIGVAALVVAIMRIKLEGRQIYMKKHVAPVVPDQKDKRNFNVIK